MPRNLIVYRGPSLINGDPIVVAITGLASRSHNAKTGDMLQAWILRADMPPTQAVNTGADEAICGQCPLRGRGRLGRACYVTWWQGPLSVYRSLSAYRTVSPRAALPLIAGERLRIGAYGDPAAVPLRVWKTLLDGLAGWTGYTHQWRTCAPGYRRFLMASVDSTLEQFEAVAKGWRTFRVRRFGDQVLGDEVICPASDEGGRRTDCHACSLCQGAARRAKSVAILPHGQRTRWLEPLLPLDGPAAARPAEVRA